MAGIYMQLPWPPSVNHYWRYVVIGHSVRAILSAKGRQYKELVKDWCITQGVFGTMLNGRLRISLRLNPPDRRRRDIDNSCKAVIDALTSAKLWRDDSQIDVLIVKRGPVYQGGIVWCNVARIQKRVQGRLL